MPVTDPKLIYNDDTNVLAYRMGLVESALDSLGSKLDQYASNCPTNSTLQLILDPLRSDIKELKDKNEQSSTEKVKHSQQMKLAIWTAIISPIATFVVTMILVSILGGTHGIHSG